MARTVHGLFEKEILALTQMLGGRADYARFVFDDLAAEVAWTSREHSAPFCLALRAAVMAFQLEFLESNDALLAHTAAVARLEAMAMMTGRGA